MDNASFAAQTKVYFNKIRRIAFREKFWKFILFACIIAFLVSIVVGEKMFGHYDDTKSGFFAICSAAIWIGIFNSIQSICKEHEIIRAEYRSGMKISSYITAHALWQLVICLIQSAIVMAVSTIFIDYNNNGLIFGSALPEYFITLFLVTYSADIMGLMVSSIAGNSTTAMIVMPFVLIVQLIMSGVLFELDGWSEFISYITLSKWGMSCFGSISNMNDMPLNASDSMDLPGKIMPKPEECYDNVASNLYTAWIACLIIGLVCYFICIASLKLRNRDS